MAGLLLRYIFLTSLYSLFLEDSSTINGCISKIIVSTILEPLIYNEKIHNIKKVIE